ncbi:UDP-GlcNAc3NAcA epimerase [Desulfuromusa kysingii]|uniref:UDP-GlcNAc3NAcA epimerase n=1 Tax=Desulfuromusa kysingii TaxID=37625 RepID=A0A1H3YHL7_9BACT|nr:UDP-N-acetylglucosamine 2-epimerase (non-hydrolyzing) [Desulfuromusa kysingii]SEA11090.1 UDP-GlcNAc3NAcA epimerase [Desulfuromusa kysingii]
MKVITILGARPQFIKAAAVSKAFSQEDNIDEILLHTGQHFDANMSDIFFAELGIPKPAYNLGIGGGSQGVMTGQQLIEIEKTLLMEKPDWVLVYGDTNSTLSGALAAVKLHIPVAHVEAGLRSFNRSMPEEINRVITDHISTLLFAPTDTAIQNLAYEGISGETCLNVGDVMYDAALLYGEQAKNQSSVLKKLELKAGSYVLATVHRAENTDDLSRLSVILKSFGAISQHQQVVWPIHPRTRKVIDKNNLHFLLGEGVRLIDPVSYLDMVMLECSASLIATDSGGVQKEAFFYSVPCVTLRDETEWEELIKLGWNRLAPPLDVEEVTTALMMAIGTQGKDFNPYGDGKAAEKIIREIVRKTV